MKLRLMTHNQWKNDKNQPAWEAIGADCSAAVRAKGFARVFIETAPDVVGIQEISPLMLSELVEELLTKGKHYTVVWGADTPIAYDSDKLDLVDSAFAFHKEIIPQFEGKFNNNKTKSYTVAVFKEKDNDKGFVFANTHLWWMSDEDQPHSSDARDIQLEEVINVAESFAKKYGCPSVVVGDLNSNYNSSTLRVAFKRGFVHAHDIATDYRDETNGCHYCFPSGYKGYEPCAFENGIDHILIKGIKDGAVNRFDRYYPEYYMPLSDHFPTYIDVEF